METILKLESEKSISTVYDKDIKEIEDMMLGAIKYIKKSIKTQKDNKKND